MCRRAVIMLSLRWNFSDPPRNRLKVRRKEDLCIAIEKDNI